MVSSRPLLSALAIVLVFAACSGTSPKAGPDEPKNIHLWKATSPSGGTAYLLGSVHFANKGASLDAATVDAYRRSDSVAVELDIEALGVREMMESFKTHGYYEDDTSLKDVLGEQDFARAQGLLSDLGITPVGLQRMRPWVLTYMLTLMTGTQNLGTSTNDGRDSGDATDGEESAGGTTLGVDRYFINTARNDSKDVISLETLEEQVLAMSSASEALQLEELETALDTAERGAVPVAAVVGAYFDGELGEELGTPPDDETEDQRAHRERIIDDRNQVMAERIAGLLDSGKRLFVVVGAAHMYGTVGIPTLLRDKGYDVESVYGTGERVALTAPEGSKAALPELRVADVSMDWPAPPVKQIVNAGGSEVEITVSTAPPLRFVLTKTTMPPALVMSLDKLYEQTLLGTEQQTGGNVTETRTVTISGIPGSRYVVSSSGVEVYGLQVWADGTLYGVAGVVPVAELEALENGPNIDGLRQEVSRILDSFSLDTYTDAEFAKGLEDASALLASKPAWLFPHPPCPTSEMIKKAQQLHDSPQALCAKDVMDCVRKCESGDAIACMRAGDHLSQHTNEAYTSAAAALHMRSCDLGLLEGCTSQAATLFLDDESEKHWTCAAATFVATCGKAEPWGCTFHGIALSRGRGIDKNLALAKERAKMACDLAPHSHACRASRRTLANLEADK